jgi:L-asparaginase
VPELKKIARVEIENVFNIGSSSMTPEYWLKLLKRANEVLADPAVTAVVVTHGTDTMEETAYFLDLTITSQKPVILVGAQLAASYRDSDGPRNLLNAVRVGLSPEAFGKGVMIVMNGQINAARDVTKTNTIMPETFKSWDFGLLGYADLETVRFYRAPLRRQTIPLDPDAKLSRVEIVFHYAGNDGSLIRALLAQGGLDGLVIAGTGLGHVGGPQYEAVKEVRERGIPVVITSRVPTGRVIPLYASAGSGVPLKQIGCVRADNLTPWKARILLLLAMTKTKNPEELQKYFDK